MTLEKPNKYPRSGVKTISVSGGEGTHTSDYQIEGFISNWSIRARNKTTHTVDTTQGGYSTKITIHTQQ